ncbi:MAG: hypothetical protein HY741_09505 [Chloroflexi bacterium]|nr:hypothetical protein [Chloroflexota bacterium]
MITYQDVIRTVVSWEHERRLALIRELLLSLEAEWRTRPVPRNTFKRALGLAATSQPAPSDEQVRDWLDEHRMEKYG